MIIFEDTDGEVDQLLYPVGYDYTYIARLFEPALEGLVNKVTVEIKGMDDTEDYGVKMQIRDVGVGGPSDDILETTTTTITYLADGWAYYEFTFAGTLELSPGTDYWAVIYRTDSIATPTSVRSSQPGGSPGKYDTTGELPWTNYTHIHNVKIEGVVAGGGGRSWGMIIA